ACLAPRCSAKMRSNSAVRGPSVSQPERSVSATASRSCGCSCRSKSGSSGKVSVDATSMPLRDVLVTRVVRVAEAPLIERLDDLGDPVGDRHQRLEAELGLDLVEADLVVARVLVLLDVADLALVGLLADLFDDVELAVVLARAARVEDVAGDLLDRRFEHGAHGAPGVTDVDVRAPELLAEDFQLLVRPQFAGELVDGQVEAHPPPDAVDGGEAQAGRGHAVAAAAEDQLLHADLLLRVQGDGAQLTVLGDRDGGVG